MTYECGCEALKANGLRSCGTRPLQGFSCAHFSAPSWQKASESTQPSIVRHSSARVLPIRENGAFRSRPAPVTYIPNCIMAASAWMNHVRNTVSEKLMPDWQRTAWTQKIPLWTPDMLRRNHVTTVINTVKTASGRAIARQPFQSVTSLSHLSS